MASLNKYAGTITQTTGGKFRTFNNLNNMKNADWNNSAVSSDWIKAKNSSPNRPSTLSFTNFNLQIPQGAEPTKVVIEYRHQKTAKVENKYPNIGAPTITLLGVSGISGKGKAPTKDSTYCTKEFRNSKLTRNLLNSNSFGVKIDYPANTNANEGKLYITYVRIAVAYITSEYSVSLKKVEGGYNEEEYTVQASISNKNMTGYNPSVTITSPLGFTFQSNKGTGEVTQVNSRTFTWNPKLNKNVGTSSMDLTFLPNVTYSGGTDTYTGTFAISENLNSASGTHTATITERPATPGEETSTDAEPYFEDETTFEDTVQTVTKDEIFDFHLKLTDSEVATITDISDYFFVACNKDYELIDPGDLAQGGYAIPVSALDSNNEAILKFKIKATGLATIGVLTGEPISGQRVTLRTWLVNTIPIENTLTNPLYTIIKLNDEELARLGHGVAYIASAFLKLVTEKTYVEKWYKNYRVGVFNNMIAENVTVTTETVDGEVIETVTDSTDYTDLSPDEVYENAEYWSPVLNQPNVWENVECEFVYNTDYPIYLIITSMYTEQNSTEDIAFINPCIIESAVYNGRENTGLYPYPFNSLIGGDGEYAELSIPQTTPVPSLVFHELPLAEDYGTNDKYAVRGVEVIGDIEKSDDIVLHAKLISPTGLKGERSIVLSDDDESFTIGGLGDLWGLSVFDFTNLEDWEIELTITNLLDTNTSTFNFGNVQIIFYIERVEHQKFQVSINGEDLAYYGAFIQDVQVDEGLNTNTGFINVDGTDTNDAYRQNIEEKEIQLEMEIGHCDLEMATFMLQQLTNILVNKKDKYNRPIPKRIECSHYPNVYWEYIIEKALDVENEYGSYYKVKATLTIPAGTSYNKKDTVTNNVGFVQGLAAVNPIIQVKPNSEMIELFESNSGQKFAIKYPNNDWSTKLVEIDCINRRVLLKADEDGLEATDISAYADKDVDWFSLYGEYNFSTANCTLRTVRYNERW